MWPRVRWDNRNKIVYIGRLKELRDIEQRTGGGGSERQRAEERDPSLPAVEEVRDREQRRENRVAEKEMRIESSGWEASAFSLKRRHFGFALYLHVPDTYPIRTKTVPEIFFLGRKLVHQAYSGIPTISVPTRYLVRVQRGFCHTSAS